MAIRSALSHSFNITAESLEGLPWEVASLLWERLVASQLVSVKVWKAFAVAYPNEGIDALKRKHHVIARPNMKLGDYVASLISPLYHWVTFLSLSNVTCSRTDLVQISQLTNLGVLTIGRKFTTPDIGLDDSIIRGWGRSASSTDAFRILRVLNCRSQKDITANVFAHLNQFPALSVFNVEDCNLGPKHRQAAQNHKWNYKTGKDLSEWLVKGGATSAGWDSIVHASFQLGGAFSKTTLTAEGVEAIDAIPVLHMSIGANQPDALVDVTGDQSLRSFYRERVDTFKFPNKRPLSQNIAPSIKMSYQKPTLRASKQQKLEDVLTGFGR
ncbi:hypothetical protein HO133_005152 [Letharia lupina]|uniref:Uncharacterized protein n=1 Tax=Letharia lupina TaxID=560253 RepID=A0A8H6C9F1_9LECA|nr:uncharacterized protein HO133_005152 [Letharia lupina]KAF6219327.1 hypothetical protein HO133_005152 [Letharia lupina]